MKRRDQECERWDAVVIGAGPAGAVAAGLLAASGAGVLLVDRQGLARDKVCGGCWSASGLSLLEAVGARQRIEALEGVPLDQIHLAVPSRELRLPIPAGVALSRSAADAALVQYAIESGAVFRPHTKAVVGPVAGQSRRVRLIAEGSENPAREAVAAKVVLAADGLGHPSLCHLSGFTRQADPGSRFGAGCQVTDFPQCYERGAIHMAVGREGYVGLVVVETGALNVAAALAPGLLRRHGSLAGAAAAILHEVRFPAVAALAKADWRGTPLLTRHESRVAAERLLLLGDAAGYAEPFTGEGMTWAVLSACAVQPVAQAACRDWRSELAYAWTAKFRKLIGRRQRLCRAVAGVLRVPLAVRAVMEVLKLAPGLAPSLVRLVGTTPGARAVPG